MKTYHFRIRLKNTTWVDIDEVTEKLIKIHAFDCMVTTDNHQCTIIYDKEHENRWMAIETALFELEKARLQPDRVDFNIRGNGLDD